MSESIEKITPLERRQRAPTLYVIIVIKLCKGALLLALALGLGRGSEALELGIYRRGLCEIGRRYGPQEIIANQHAQRSSSDCFMAHTAARCIALCRLRSFWDPDFSPSETSSNAARISSSSASSERKADDKLDSRDSEGGRIALRFSREN